MTEPGGGARREARAAPLSVGAGEAEGVAAGPGVVVAGLAAEAAGEVLVWWAGVVVVVVAGLTGVLGHGLAGASLELPVAVLVDPALVDVDGVVPLALVADPLAAGLVVGVEELGTAALVEHPGAVVALEPEPVLAVGAVVVVVGVGRVVVVLGLAAAAG